MLNINVYTKPYKENNGSVEMPGVEPGSAKATFKNV